MTLHHLKIVVTLMDMIHDPTDTYAASDSHGTHVATTISALNDGLNINGFGIQTVPIRVLGADGTGFNSDIAQGLLYAGSSKWKWTNLFGICSNKGYKYESW